MKTYYLTRYALNEGIYTVSEKKVYDNYIEYDFVTDHEEFKIGHLNYDLFDTEYRAIAKAEEMRSAEIKNLEQRIKHIEEIQIKKLKEQIKKLKAIKFDVN